LERHQKNPGVLMRKTREIVEFYIEKANVYYYGIGGEVSKCLL